MASHHAAWRCPFVQGRDTGINHLQCSRGITASSQCLCCAALWKKERLGLLASQSFPRNHALPLSCTCSVLLRWRQVQGHPPPHACAWDPISSRSSYPSLDELEAGRGTWEL